MSTAATVLTPNDLLQMGSAGKGYELVNGELKEVEVSTESSHVAGEICTLLKNHCKARQPAWVFPEGTGYTCFPDDESRVRKPDTSYIALARFTAEQYRAGGWIPVVPDLAVEVVSPTPRDGRRDRVEKVREYAAFGVKWYWIADPQFRSLEVFELGADGRYVKAVGAASGVVTDLPGCAGLTVDLDALWARVSGLEADAGEA